jgi:hypothetical protein
MKAKRRQYIYISLLIATIFQLFSNMSMAGTISTPAKAANSGGGTCTGNCAPGFGGSYGAGASGSGTITPDLFTGTLSYSLPIEVLAGRNGMQPALSRTGAIMGIAGSAWVGNWNSAQ